MRLRLLLIGLLLTAIGGCGLLPPQEPYDPADAKVTSFRGGRYWTAPGGFGPEFWSRFQ
jgi:hypothetical protein